jgi:hypothetical protein
MFTAFCNQHDVWSGVTAPRLSGATHLADASVRGCRGQLQGWRRAACRSCDPATRSNVLAVRAYHRRLGRKVLARCLRFDSPGLQPSEHYQAPCSDSHHYSRREMTEITVAVNDRALRGRRRVSSFCKSLGAGRSNIIDLKPRRPIKLLQIPEIHQPKAFSVTPAYKTITVSNKNEPGQMTA